MVSRLGTIRRPVRSSGDLLSGRLVGPVPWTVADAGSPSNTAVWWVGQSEESLEPIGPNGPWPTTGATMPVVTRATSLLVDPLTTGRFRVRRRGLQDNPVGTLTEAPRWLTDPMLLRPDARIGPSPIPAAQRLARSVFWRLWVAQAVWWGKSYLYFLEAADGQPLAGTMRIIQAGMVETNDDGRWEIDGYEFDDDGRRNGGRLVCLTNPHTDQGVFLQHPEVFSLGRSLATYASSTFRAGVPAGYLKVTAPGLTGTQAQELKDGWTKAHGGDSRSVAVLNATTDFQAISWSPVDAALAEVKRLSIADTAFAFGMAPETLGVTLGNSATYSNVAQWFEAHRDFALSPWIGAVEGLLSCLMPVDQEVEVNLDAYTQPEFGERMAAYSVAITAGVLTADECRALEGLSPLGDPKDPPADDGTDAPFLAPGEPATAAEAEATTQTPPNAEEASSDAPA